MKVPAHGNLFSKTGVRREARWLNAFQKAEPSQTLRDTPKGRFRKENFIHMHDLNARSRGPGFAPKGVMAQDPEILMRELIANFSRLSLITSPALFVLARCASKNARTASSRPIPQTGTTAAITLS